MMSETIIERVDTSERRRLLASNEFKARVVFTCKMLSSIGVLILIIFTAVIICKKLFIFLVKPSLTNTGIYF